MTVKTFWVCDGCDDNLLWNAGMATDWKVVSVTLEGFRGYPTAAAADPEVSTYHLCPSCSRQFWKDAHPRQWPRAAVAVPEKAA